MWNPDAFCNGWERKQWSYADEALEHDKSLLRAPALPSGFRSETVDGSEEDSRLAIYTHRFDSLDDTAKRKILATLRVVPVDRNGRHPDWEAFAALLEAQTKAESYTDGDGDETYLPDGAEVLVDFWRQAKEQKLRAKEERALLKAKRPGEEAIRGYSPAIHFQLGEWITHSKFGRGIVLESSEKIRVKFDDAERLLGHAPRPPTAACTPKADVATKEPAAKSPPPSVKIQKLAPDPLFAMDANEREAASAERFTTLAREARKRARRK